MNDGKGEPLFLLCFRQCITRSFKNHLKFLLQILATLFSLKTMETLQNRVAIHFRAAPLFSMRTVSLASLQSCGSVDTDARCKWALNKTRLFANALHLRIHNLCLSFCPISFCLSVCLSDLEVSPALCSWGRIAWNPLPAVCLSQNISFSHFLQETYKSSVG